MNTTTFKKNIRIIAKFSIIDIKRRFKTSIFSWLWLVVAPLLMIFTYWFGMGSMGGDSVKLVTYVVGGQTFKFQWFAWILVGAFTWAYLGDMIISGPSATWSYQWMPGNFGISPSIPPFIVNLSRIITGIPWIILAWIVTIILNATDPSEWNSSPITIYALEVPIVLMLMVVAMSILGYALGPLFSISKDFRNLVAVVPGVLSWLTGVFIMYGPNAAANPTPATLHSFRYIITQINPLNFVMNGLRSTTLGYGELFTPNFYCSWYSIVSFFLFFTIVGLVGWKVNRMSNKFIMDII